MAVIVDVPGVGPVEARNAATESTLRELVNAIKSMSGSSAGAAGAGAAGAGAAGGILTGLSKATKGATNSAKEFAGGTKSVSGAAANAAKTIGKGFTGAIGLGVKGIFGIANAAKLGAQGLASLTQSSAELIEQFANVGNSLTSAAQTLRPIPIIGGPLAATLGAVAGAATETTNAFKTAAGSGATFGGSVNEMARSASQAGMTISDFAALVSASGEALLGFGNTTEGGAKNFARLSKDLRSTSSDLYALGFGTKEINEGLANYGKLMRSQGRAGTQSNAQLVSGARKYLKELDMLSKVTGKNRQELEAQRQALAVDGQFRAAMAGLGPEVEASADLMINSMPTPELQAFAKDIIANGTATTDANRLLMSQMPGLAAELQRMHKTTQSNNAISTQAMNQAMNNAAKEAKISLQRGKTAFAANEEMHGMAGSLGALTRIQQDAIDQGLKDQDKAAAATDGQVKTVEQAQEALANFSNSFQMALANSGLLNLLMDAFGFLANIVQTFVIPAFNMLSPILAKMFYGIEALAMPVIEALSGSLGSLDGVASFISDTLDVAFGILDAVVRSVIDVFRSAYGAVQRILEPFKRITERVSSTGDAMDGLTEIIASAGTIIGGTFEFLGEIIGGTIELFMDLWDWLMSFEILSSMAQKVADGFDTLKTYLSADGAKLLLAQVRDFFVNSIGGFFADLLDNFEGFFITLQNALPNVLGGISDEEAEERRKALEEKKKEREESAALAKTQIEHHKSNMMTTRAAKEVAETERKAANKVSRAEFSERMKGIKGIGAANDKEAGVRKDALKGKEEAVKNFNDPIQLLMAEAKQQGTANALGGIKTPEAKAAAAAATAKTGVEAKAMEKIAEEQKAKETTKSAVGGGVGAASETAPATGGQTSGQTAIAQLNTNIEELVRLMRINNSLTSEQSSGLSRLAGSVTGDLFQV